MKKLQVEFVSCKHHVRGFVTVDGKKLFPVHCSFGSKDLPGNVPHLFRKSLKLDVQEFGTLRGCTIDRQKYLEILKAKGVLPP